MTKAKTATVEQAPEDHAKPAHAPSKRKASKAVAHRPAAPSQAVALATTYSPPELLNAAIMQKADITVIERLAALAERWQAMQVERDARVAFAGAFTDAKAEIPVILKNRTVKFESTKAPGGFVEYDHEDLGGIAEVIDPILSKFGLTYRWELDEIEGGRFKVTCILMHRSGHSERAWSTAARDTSGAKNDIQGRSSSETYLKRSTLKAVVGIATGERDDDGRGAGDPDKPRITAEQAEKIEALLVAKKRNREAFLNWCGGIAKIEDLDPALYDDVIATLEKLP